MREVSLYQYTYPALKLTFPKVKRSNRLFSIVVFLFLCGGPGLGIFVEIQEHPFFNVFYTTRRLSSGQPRQAPAVQTNSQINHSRVGTS